MTTLIFFATSVVEFFCLFNWKNIITIFMFILFMYYIIAVKLCLNVKKQCTNNKNYINKKSEHNQIPNWTQNKVNLQIYRFDVDERSRIWKLEVFGGQPGIPEESEPDAEVEPGDQLRRGGKSGSESGKFTEFGGAEEMLEQQVDRCQLGLFYFTLLIF